MNDKTCQECIYCRRDGKCMLEVLDGSDPEECRAADYKWFEARDE